MNIRLTEAQKIKILNSDDIYSVMQRILLRENKIERDKEHFWIIGLAQNNRILYVELISLGTVNKTLVDPMEVFSIALQKRSVKIILVHNHPSGELTPSAADKDITDHLIQVGRIVNIEVIEHLIISEKSYLSFVDTGLFNDLEFSTKWVPDYQLKLKYEKGIADAEKAIKKAEKEKVKEMAKTMKKKGYSTEEIIDLTELSKASINRLKVD